MSSTNRGRSGRRGGRNGSGAPHNGQGQGDPAIAAMYRELGRVRKESFKVFALSLKIFPGAMCKIPAKSLPRGNLDMQTWNWVTFGDDAYRQRLRIKRSEELGEPSMRINSVYETDASEEVAKPYTFVGCRGFSKIMSVKTMRYHKGNLDVQVLFDGRWVPFWLWLEDVDFDPPTGKIGFDLQRGWWKSTEKTFKLLELPAELRNAVYKHSLGSEIFPSHESSTDPETGTETIQVVLGRGWTEKLADGNTRDPREAGVDAPNLALTQVNKQIRGEALHYAWELMPKVFTSSSKLHEIGREMDQDLPFQSTGHIVLDFLTVDYINFFEVPLPGLHPHQILSTQPLGSCLDKDLLPNLKHLEIRFQSTKLGPATDPWGRTEDGYIRFESSFHTACHKVLIDWIMVFAVGYIKHIPRVELKGYVKTSLKQKWEAILADERKGIVHDLTTEKAVVQALTINNVPPACYCTKPCHFDGMQNIEARQGRDWEHVFPQKHRIAMMNHYSFDFND